MINKSNNPKENVKKAVALSYNSDDDAPKVIAKGEGLVAENIVKKAMESDLPIYEDKDLVDNLIQVDIDNSIPVELYEAVAEILLYIHRLDVRRGREDE